MVMGVGPGGPVPHLKRKGMKMDGIEAMARREGLGMDRLGLAGVLGCDEQTVEAFETGRQPVPISVEARLAGLEFARDQIAGVLEGRFTPPVLLTYINDQTFWQAWPGMEGVPVGVHRAATADALKSLRWAGLEARIEAAPVQG